MAKFRWVGSIIQKIRRFLGLQSRPSMSREGMKFMMDEFRSTRGRGGGFGPGG